MRILLYVERDRTDARQHWNRRVLESVLRMVDEQTADAAEAAYSQADVRVLMHSEHRSMMRVIRAAHPERIIQVTDVQSSDQRGAVRSSGLPLAVRRSRLHERRDAALDQHALGRIKHSLFDFDVLVHWGADPNIRCYAERLSADCVSVGDGLTSRSLYDAVYFDPFGHGGASLLHKVELDQVEPLSPEALRGLLPMYSVGGLYAAYRPLTGRYAARLYENAGKNVLAALPLESTASATGTAAVEQLIHDLGTAGYTCWLASPDAADGVLNSEEGALLKRLARRHGKVVAITGALQYLSLLRHVDYVAAAPGMPMYIDGLILEKPIMDLSASAHAGLPDVPTLAALVLGRSTDELSARSEQSARRLATVALRHYLLPSQLAFKSSWFINYVERACRCRQIYEEQGTGDMTRHLLSSPALERRHTRELLAQAPSSRGQREAAGPFQQGDVCTRFDESAAERWARKLRKFKRDPRRFLNDSSLRPLRLLARPLRTR